MKTVRTVAEVRAALREARRAERVIGLVPTMGALHDGHLSLIRRARATCDEVVVSLFVNPAQFNESSDLAAYPRDEARDGALAAEAGADVLFAPQLAEVYPPGFATTVHIGGVTETREGEYRGVGHFEGVATVVTKLLNMVAPDVAFFGQKDAQQALSSAAWCATSICPCASRCARRCARPTGWRSRAATSTCAAPTASERSRCAMRWRPPRRR